MFSITLRIMSKAKFRDNAVLYTMLLKKQFQAPMLLSRVLVRREYWERRDLETMVAYNSRP